MPHSLAVIPAKIYIYIIFMCMYNDNDIYKIYTHTDAHALAHTHTHTLTHIYNIMIMYVFSPPSSSRIILCLLVRHLAIYGAKGYLYIYISTYPYINYPGIYTLIFLPFFRAFFCCFSALGVLEAHLGLSADRDGPGPRRHRCDPPRGAASRNQGREWDEWDEWDIQL